MDVRVTAATNRDLAAGREAGAFREDLYFRLAEFHVEIPPLRVRGDDVLLLAAALIEHDAAAFDRGLPTLESR